MKHYRLLFAIFTITLLAFGGWFAILETTDPYAYGAKGQALFYAFFAIFLWGTATMINYTVKKNRKNSSKIASLKNAVRQGLIASLGLVGLLILRSIDVLNILSAGVYIIALILIEFFFRHRRTNYA